MEMKLKADLTKYVGDDPAWVGAAIVLLIILAVAVLLGFQWSINYLFETKWSFMKSTILFFWIVFFLPKGN
jgi:hypothetical protein